MIRILSIDDSKAVHAFLKTCLAGTHCELTTASSGAAGIELLKKDAAFQVVLLDWEMPEMSGPEVFEVIHQAYPELPVVMVTSKNELTDISSMLQRGAVEYIMKPFTQDILIEKISAVTGSEVRVQ